MKSDIGREIRDQFSQQDLRFTPFRSVNDFILDATWNTPNFADLPRLNKRIVSNLIYYQTNYFVFGIALFLLVGISYPIDFLFGLVVVLAVLMGFVYLSSSPGFGNNSLAATEQFIRSAKEDRPLIVLVGILGISYLILSFLGKLMIFLVGIVLPIQLIILHAAFRTRNLANKVANKFERLGVQATPMGVFLSALGLRSASLLE
ncbi:unnamed protein product [Rotaria magnacalcarata]|uniref:PRA1 family protein n=1 Tax=Rotaria magnacalcarata TaxID=392030 RepID=A0A816RHE8_9BILA|nr:unnamed protein product [Rotaria magnacalcarata]CAF1554599.1 unnamed protein product [Rotaria magnacalcarata]CAF1927963.1 unnamed protein product [Rotaria magnacalcarata]CAF2075177.1 unnamed protein product [Rotaria magnacalcarata]CAF2126999.1 unnamed protein product [Rotaria magnacalcarata]